MGDQSPAKEMVVVYSILGCPHCISAKQKLGEMKIPFTDVRLDLYPDVKETILEKSGMRTVPQIYFGSCLVGGNEALQKLVNRYGKDLAQYIDKQEVSEDPTEMPIIPDPSTAIAEPDPFGFQCEIDESYLLLMEMKEDGILKTHGSFFSKKKNAFSGKEFIAWAQKRKSLGEGDQSKSAV